MIFRGHNPGFAGAKPRIRPQLSGPASDRPPSRLRVPDRTGSGVCCNRPDGATPASHNSPVSATCAPSPRPSSGEASFPLQSFPGLTPALLRPAPHPDLKPIRPAPPALRFSHTASSFPLSRTLPAPCHSAGAADFGGSHGQFQLFFLCRVRNNSTYSRRPDSPGIFCKFSLGSGSGTESPP